MEMLRKSKIFISVGVILILLSVLLVWKNLESVEVGLDVSCTQFTLTSAKERSNEIKSNKDQYIESSMDANGFSTEGGIRTKYEDQVGSVVFISQLFFGETGKSEEEYYYLNEKLFYLSKTNYMYANHIAVDPDSRVVKMEKQEFLLGADNTVCEWYKDGELQENDFGTQDLVNHLVGSLEDE